MIPGDTSFEHRMCASCTRNPARQTHDPDEVEKRNQRDARMNYNRADVCESSGVFSGEDALRYSRRTCFPQALQTAVKES